MSQVTRTGSPAHFELNPFLEGWLERLGADGPVLDLGCGHGFWTRHMAEAGMSVVGIEPEVDRAVEALHDVRATQAGHDVRATQAGHDVRAGQAGHDVRATQAGHDVRATQAGHDAKASVIAGDGGRLPLRDGSMGLVWCVHVLHHSDDPVEVLSEVRRVLRPGGHLVLAETVEDNPAIRVARRFHPEWDGVPIRSRFTAARLLRMLDDAGLDVVDRRQHSLVSFAAWTLPRAGRRTWLWVSGLEDRLPSAWTTRWGAHVECVVRRR